jgi:hypothetical protein
MMMEKCVMVFNRAKRNSPLKREGRKLPSPFFVGYYQKRRQISKKGKINHQNGDAYSIDS